MSPVGQAGDRVEAGAEGDGTEADLFRELLLRGLSGTWALEADGLSPEEVTDTDDTLLVTDGTVVLPDDDEEDEDLEEELLEHVRTTVLLGYTTNSLGPVNLAPVLARCEFDGVIREVDLDMVTKFVMLLCVLRAPVVLISIWLRPLLF